MFHRNERIRPGHPHLRRSFTLIEAVLAVVILATAIPPMMWAIREGHFQRVTPILASRARWLAVSKLEDIIADRHSVSGSRGYDYLVTGNYPAEALGSLFWSNFARSVTLVENDATLTGPVADGGYMVITVQVTWTDMAANSVSLSVSTILTEYTPL